MNSLKQHTSIAVGYFLTAALLGILLRLFFIIPISGNFRYVVHGHSHIALLGWVYLGLITLIYKLYFSKEKISETYLRIFWFTNFTLLGMLVTFPFTGYALFSIIFSTLFLLASYWAVWYFFKNIPEQYRFTYSWKLIKKALIYLVVSSIGPWAIGGVMATIGNTSIWYKLSIYFYLHFQYNAWFILALLGVLFFTLEKAGLILPQKDFKIFFWMLNAGLILSLFLSALWVNPPVVIYLLGAAGAILQVAAFLKLFLILKKFSEEIRELFSPFVHLLLKISGFLLAGKVLMQLLTAIPFFANLAFLYTDFIIGYLHWVFLGVVSIALFAFLNHFLLLKVEKVAFHIYFTGFLLSEVLIFFKGISIWQQIPFFQNYFLILVVSSSLMVVGIGIFLTKNISGRLTKGKSHS